MRPWRPRPSIAGRRLQRGDLGHDRSRRDKMCRGEIDIAPRLTAVEQRAKRLIVVLMARAKRVDPPDDRRPGEIQIADAIENLMSNELVLVAQAFFVEDAVAAHHDGIVQRAAAREPGGAELLDLVQKPESARARHFGAERCWRQRNVAGLLPDRRAFEIDLEVDRKPRARKELDAALPVVNTDALEDFDAAARRVLLDYARAVDEEQERRRAAVHHRRLGAVDFNDQVVDFGAV